MTVLKGQLETHNGEIMYPKTSIDMVVGMDSSNMLKQSDILNAESSATNKVPSAGYLKTKMDGINSKLLLKSISNVFSAYQNKCIIGKQELHASDVYFDFKIDITMQYAISVGSETIVATITNSKYRPKNIKQFPLLEYTYGSLSVLLVYPNGNVSIYIPKGGAISSNFPTNQQLSLRGSYPI